MALSVYSTLLLIGALGLLAQTLLGFAHGHGHAPGDHGHAGPMEVGGAHGGHSHDGGHGHGHTGHGHGNHDTGADRPVLSALWALFSPLTIFSLCIGAGATGLIAGPYLSPLPTALAATAGGTVFYGLLVRPLWALIFKFASEPSRALEGSVAAPAEALTRFDATGRGLVRLTIDGQIVRVLAELEADEREAAGAIQPGDIVVVTSIDPHANTCRISRM